jgi:hypothetical protein
MVDLICFVDCSSLRVFNSLLYFLCTRVLPFSFNKIIIIYLKKKFKSHDPNGGGFVGLLERSV